MLKHKKSLILNFNKFVYNVNFCVVSCYTIGLVFFDCDVLSRTTSATFERMFIFVLFGRKCDDDGDNDDEHIFFLTLSN